MNNNVKCKNCGKEIDKSTAFKIGKASYYCSEECYNIKMSKRKSQKAKYEPREGTDRREYTNYIQKIYLENGYDKSEINWTLLMAQTKNILSENKKWSYATLQYILYYIYEILELNLFAEESNGSILSLISFYGLEAEKYYNECVIIEQSINNFDFTDNIKTVHQKHNIDKNKKQIDLKTLLGGDNQE